MKRRVVSREPDVSQEYIASVLSFHLVPSGLFLRLLFDPQSRYDVFLRTSAYLRTTLL
jgi:hypothetical protein